MNYHDTDIDTFILYIELQYYPELIQSMLTVSFLSNNAWNSSPPF